MSKRAKRLEKYLSEHLGWETDGAIICDAGCEGYVGSGKFCQKCGSKTKQEDSSETIKQLEGALKWTLSSRKHLPDEE